MRIKHSAKLLASAGLFAALSLSQSAFAEHHTAQASDKAMVGHSVGSKELHQAMMSGHDMRMPMSGNVDKDFAMMMTMHHQQAVKMVDVLLQRGKSEELKALARKMKAAQLSEINKMAAFAGPMDHSKMSMGKGKMEMQGSMETDHGKMAETEFNKLDVNKDGKISRAEIPSKHPMNQHFGMLDANKDGSMGRAEFAKHHGM